VEDDVDGRQGGEYNGDKYLISAINKMLKVYRSRIFIIKKQNILHANSVNVM
jgi:hypothetical protein